MINHNTESILPVIDAHTHIFPGAIAHKAAENIGNFYNLDMYTEGTLETLALARNTVTLGRQIKMQVVFSPAITPMQTKSINTFISDCCKKDSALIGFGTLHRDNDDFKEEIKRIKALGLKGIKFHSDFQKTDIDDEKMLPIYKEIAKNNLPVIFHMGDKKLCYSSVEKLKNVLSAVPSLTVTAAHMGGYLHWDDAYTLLPTSNRLYFDISSSLSFLPKEKCYSMFDKFGCDRFFFGSDFPMWNPSEELCRLAQLNLPEKVRRGIEYTNFADFIEKFS